MMDPLMVPTTEEECEDFLDSNVPGEFLYMQCNEDLQLTKTPIYDQIAERFPVLLARKLIFTADECDLPARPRNCSAVLILDMAKSDRLDAAFATDDIDDDDIEDFRESAINLLRELPDGSPLNAAGKELSKKLLRLAFQHHGAWDDFAFKLQRSFQVQDESSILYSFLSVFCELDDDNLGLDADDAGAGRNDLRRGYACDIEPILKDFSNRFHSLLVDLLRQEEAESKNYTAFQILPFFHEIFTQQNQQKELMEAAIMSPLFDRGPFNQKALAAATYLRACIDRGDEFTVSPAIFERLISIAFRLHEMSRLDAALPRAVTAAEQFKAAIGRRACARNGH